MLLVRSKILFQPLKLHSVVKSRNILPNVEEVEDQVVGYPIRMTGTGSHAYRRIGRMN
jgi:hypothetical protein